MPGSRCWGAHVTLVLPLGGYSGRPLRDGDSRESTKNLANPARGMSATTALCQIGARQEIKDTWCRQLGVPSAWNKLAPSGTGLLTIRIVLLDATYTAVNRHASMVGNGWAAWGSTGPTCRFLRTKRRTLCQRTCSQGTGDPKQWAADRAGVAVWWWAAPPDHVCAANPVKKRSSDATSWPRRPTDSDLTGADNRS